MHNASSIKLIKRRVSRGNKNVIKLILVRFGGRDYKQTSSQIKSSYITTKRGPYSKVRFVPNVNPQYIKAEWMFIISCPKHANQVLSYLYNVLCWETAYFLHFFTIFCNDSHKFAPIVALHHTLVTCRQYLRISWHLGCANPEVRHVESLWDSNIILVTCNDYTLGRARQFLPNVICQVIVG